MLRNHILLALFSDCHLPIHLREKPAVDQHFITQIYGITLFLRNAFGIPETLDNNLLLRETKRSRCRRLIHNRAYMIFRSNSKVYSFLQAVLSVFLMRIHDLKINTKNHSLILLWIAKLQYI